MTPFDTRVSLPWWWYITPAYLTLWTLVFATWNLLDGNGMMAAFGVDTGGASDFIMLNSAVRYMAIGVVMIFGIWIFRSATSIFTALLARLAMDLGDLWAGLQTGLVADATGVAQSFAMFLAPNLFAIGTLWVLLRRRTR